MPEAKSERRVSVGHYSCPADNLEKFFARDEASIRGFFDWMPWLLWGLAPPLTMRLWSDERRLGTWEILATTPVTSRSLVIGKFLASWGLLALALLFTLALPIVVMYPAEPGSTGRPSIGMLNS